MIDNERRMAAAIAICEYLNANIGSHALDDVMWKCRESNDVTCNALCSAIWYFHSDSDNHKNIGKWEIAPDFETMARRWLRILRSDWEMADPIQVSFLAALKRILWRDPLPFNHNRFWPFANEDKWNAWLFSQT
jgi:hypothetical protein